MSGHVPTHFYIATLGCKLNFAESSALVKAFTDAGMLQTRQAAEADWIIVHSCAVTAVAEKKTRQTVSKLMKAAPNASFAVTGCMADVNKDSLEGLLASRKHLIAQHTQKMKLADIIANNIVSNDTTNMFAGAYSLEQRTRSFLKIQDGCDYFCTYCTVPYARGRSVSNTIAGVLSDIEEISSKGFREIILTGVNIGTFGLNNNENFFGLLKAIDNQFSNVRIRLGSTEPELMSAEIIDQVASSKVLMPHFHLPLQSGCDATLERMHRRYNTALFRQRVELIKQKIPFACIAVDVITGFPGETDDEFEQTFNFISSLPLSYLHVFPYSDRPLAKASKYTDHIHQHVIRQRVNRLLELGNEKQHDFFSEHAGTVRSLLVEGTRKNGLQFGFTDNYIKCAIPESSVIENEIHRVLLNYQADNEDFMFAQVID